MNLTSSKRTANSSCFCGGHMMGIPWNKMFLEQPTVPVSGESKYLTPLWVSGNVEPQKQHHQSESSQPVTIVSKLQSDSLYDQEIEYKIRAALKLLTFREQHVLLQFWLPRDVGKHQLLTTINQPFGVGVVGEELCFYRRDSEHNAFLVNKHHEKEVEDDDISPPARVYMRGLPEWTTDVANYKAKDFPQQECASRCNLHGYLALPVSDPTTGLCVGVLELLTSSKLEDFNYEVDHIHQELKKGSLTSPKPFDGPASNVFHERNKTELDKIFSILKAVCDTHSLPLAQTWTVLPSTCYFAHGNVLHKGCSSFDTRCFGKVCMSTTLPFYVRDLSAWPFMQASKECHLEMSRGVAGRALSSRGSCFCGDVTKIDEDEYPLVHNARMSGLTSCFAIFLHSVEYDDDYVLEFFLPININNNQDVLNLVQTIKQSIQAASGFELGDASSIDCVGPPMDMSINETDSSNLESIVTETSEHDYANVSDQWPLTNNSIMVNVSFNKSMEQFAFPLFHGLLKLKNEVAKRFRLDDQRLRLKYMDEDDDLILICGDDDLKSALDDSETMNLICLEG